VTVSFQATINIAIHRLTGVQQMLFGLCSDISDSGAASWWVRCSNTEACSGLNRRKAACTRLWHVRQCLPRWSLRSAHALQRSVGCHLTETFCPACIHFSVTVFCWPMSFIVYASDVGGTVCMTRRINFIQKYW